MLRKRFGVAVKIWAQQSITCKKQRAAPRATALAHPDNSTLHTGKILSFPLHISRVVLLLLRQRRRRSNDLGTTIKYLGKNTCGAAALA
jgi:hypothetical protein